MVAAVEAASGHGCSAEIARGLEGIGLVPADIGRVEVVARYSGNRERERLIGYLVYVGRADNAGVYLVNLRRNCALMNVSGG